MKKVLLNIIITILTIILLILIYGFIQLNILKKDYLNFFGYTYFQTQTGSMSGTIEIDDIVIVKLGNNVKENDIITYKKDGYFITHRYIRTEGDKIIAKGDSNNKEDEPIEKDTIVGKVQFIIKNVRVWKKVFSDIRVIIPLIVTVILLGIIIVYKERK